MKRCLRLPVFFLLLISLLLTLDSPARANDVPSSTQIVLIFAGVAVVGAAIGVGIYYAVRKAPSITGCATSGPAGLTLENEGDRKIFFLMGDTAGIKSGERVRVKGKKKKTATGSPSFLVDKLSRDYGACKAALATP